MIIINYSNRERFLIFSFSIILFISLFALHYLKAIDAAGWMFNIAYYFAGITMIYSLIAFPVWKSDIRDGETKEHAKYRYFYPEASEAFDMLENEERKIKQGILDDKKEVVEFIAEKYPNWTEDVCTSEFLLWLGKQSPVTKFLADSEDPRDALRLLGLYRKHTASMKH